MNQDKINEVIKSLIEQHGENSTIKFAGKTYRKINLYLIAFERFAKNINQLINKLNLKVDGEVLNEILEYCKYSEYISLDAISERFECILKKCEKNGRPKSIYVNKLNSVFQALSSKMDKIKQNPLRVEKIMFNELSIDNLETGLTKPKKFRGFYTKNSL